MSSPIIQMYTPLRDYAENRDKYQQAINTVLEHGLFINGPEISELEDKLASYSDVKHCVALSSGTDALLVALMALGVKPGDEVITVAHTWISTAEVISVLGAKPVFVDIHRDTFLMDLQEIDNLMETKVKNGEKMPVGMIYVSLYGQMQDPRDVMKIAKKWNMWCIDDGAQAFGAEFVADDGSVVRCGGWGDVSCTSFFPSKPLGGYGDSGACFTNDDELDLKLKAIRNHGGLKRFHHTLVGLNARMDTIQAAVLLVKFDVFCSEDGLEKRRQIADYYDRGLSNIDGLVIPKRIEGVKHAWAQYTMLVTKNGVKRDDVVEALKERGINVAVFYPKGLHEQVAFDQIGQNYLPNTEWVCDHVLNLPLFPELTEEELSRIVKSVKEIMNNLE